MFQLFLRYLAAVITDGDWLNDWLTHVPPGAQDFLIQIGKEVAMWMGF